MHTQHTCSHDSTPVYLSRVKYRKKHSRGRWSSVLCTESGVQRQVSSVRCAASGVQRQVCSSCNMIKRSLLIIALAVMCAVGILQQDSCQPDCNGNNPLDKVPDPMNCTNYYICIGDGIPSDHAVPCPTDNYFDPEELNCAPMPDGGCEATCKPSDCHITCNGSFSLISDAFDCGKYYICIAGSPDVTITCTSDAPYFNGENCVSDKDVCCTVSCVPYCQPGIVQTPDPTDCTKYYICTAEGPVDPSLHFPCDSEHHFDYQTGRCVSGSSCTNLCPSPSY